MSNFLKSNKIKLAVGAIIVGVLCMLCAIAVAPNLAKAEDEAQSNGDRIVNLEVYNGSYGKIEIDGVESGVITIPSEETTDTYTLN